MPERKWGQDAIENSKQQFQAAAGKAYLDASFQTPEAVPEAIRKIVAAIKVLEASSRQMEIIAEARQSPKAGDFFVLPKEKDHLPDEHAELARIIHQWSGFQ